MEQNPDRQIEAIGDCARVFTDRASGGSTDRPELAAMMLHVREGDELVVASMDRLARSLVDLQRLVDELTNKGVKVSFVTEGLTFSAERQQPLADLMLGLLGAVAQFERALIRERQQAGIEAAKSRGAYKGRKPALTEEQKQQLLQRAEQGESRTDLAAEFGISRATLYNYLTQATAAP